jgi:small subunit ribosomal protein S15
MHSGKKGKSGSTPPSEKESPTWVEYTPAQTEKLITELANQGKTQAEIGTILRDQHGIPSIKKLCKKTVGKILEEQKIQPEIPEDLMNLIRSSVAQQKHMKENKKDNTAKRGYILTVSKIRRLVKYYQKQKRIQSNWKYTPETAALLVK